MSQATYRRAVTNGLSHFAAVAINLATGFVVIPIVIHGIGITEFGIWAVASTLTGYMSLLDLGLGQTVTKKTSELLALKDERRLGETVNLVFTLFSGIAVLVVLITAALVYLAPFIFNVPAGHEHTLRLALLILGLTAALSLPMSVLGGIIGGLQDFYFSNLQSSILNIAKALLTVLLVARGYGLVALILLAATVSVAGWLGNYFWVRRRLPELRIRPIALAWRPLAETLRFSSSMSIWALAGLAIQSADRIVVAVLMPVRFAGIYEVGARLNAYSRYAINVVFVAMPAAASLFAEGKHADLRAFYLHGTKYVMAIYGVIAAAVLVLGREFVHLWVGPEFDESVTVARILVLATFFQSQNSLGHMVLVGTGRLRVFTAVMAAYPFAVVALAAALGLAMGLAGVAAGILAAIVCLEAVLLAHLGRVLAVAPHELLANVHARVAPGLAGGIVVALVLQAQLGAGTWTLLLAKLAALVATYAAIFFAVGLERAERDAVLGRLASVARQISFGRR